MKITPCITVAALFATQLVAQEVKPGADWAGAVAEIELNLVGPVLEGYGDLYRASALMTVCGARDPAMVFKQQKADAVENLFAHAEVAVNNNPTLKQLSPEVRGMARASIGLSLSMMLSNLQTGYAEGMGMLVELDSEMLDAEYIKLLACQTSNQMAVDILSEKKK